MRAIKAGADDFLIKPVSADQLLQAIERAMAHHEISRSLKVKLDMVRSHIARLTPREKEVFLLIVRGQTNKQIGNVLGTSGRTIKAHRQKLMEKNASPHPGGTGVYGRTDRCLGRHIRQPPDGLTILNRFSLVIVLWDNCVWYPT